MTTLEARFERAIAKVLRVTPRPSPQLVTYIQHLRTHAQLSARADWSSEAYDQWEASVDDDSTWRALSAHEQQLFRATL